MAKKRRRCGLSAARGVAEPEVLKREEIAGDRPLQESETWLQAIFDSVPSGIIIVDPDRHVIIDINPAAARMFGSERKHIIGSVCHKYICPAEIGNCPITDLGKTIDKAERVLLTANGDACPVLKTVTPILMGEKTYLIESVTDITDRKKAEERVRQSEEKFRGIFENAVEGIFQSTPEFAFLEVNPACAAMHGYASPEQMIEDVNWRGRDLFANLEQKQRYKELLEANEVVREFEAEFYRIDGGTFRGLINCRAIRDAGGNIIRHEGTVEDITEREEAARALRTSHERYRRLFDEATEGIALADHETGVLMDCNQAFLDLTGYERSELIGQPHTMIRPSKKDNLPFHRPNTRGEVLRDVIVTKSGTPREVEIKTDVIDFDGLRVMQGFFRDVTEERRGQREREITLTLLRLLNDQRETRELIRGLTGFLQEWTACEAVGVRLRQGDDFPYFETRGFSSEFEEAETSLCLKGRDGRVVRNPDGSPVLECLCGSVLTGRCNPDLPFFTRRGSFWTNSTSDMTMSRTEKDCQIRTRNRCNGEGYESVALIPLRYGNEVLGLLQLNNRGRGRFSPGIISLLENAAEQIAIALAQRQAQTALAMSERRFRDISEAAGEFLLEMDREGRLTFLSDRAKDVLEYEPGELLGLTLFDLTPPSESGHARLFLSEHLRGQTGFRDFEVPVLTKSGLKVWLNVTAVPTFDAGGAFLGHRGAAMDITGRKRAEERLLHDAFYDELTDLPNRALFMDRLGHALKRANRAEDYSCAVIFLDLDRFKVVNDSLGHMVGDKLLKETARRLEKCVRSGDTVARLGGDEFVMLFEQTSDVETARAIADRIQKALSAPFMIEGSEIRCSASMGIALTSPNYERPEEVLRDADITMYRAKALGRARCEVFDPSMRLEAVALLHLENDLRRALEMSELRIHYQPIVALRNGELMGLEALIRWQHPRRGLVPPGDFIPLAEETGLIVPIGEWVLRTACSQMKTWQEEGLAPLRMAVNISAVQLRQPDFADMVMKVLQDTGIEPGLLDLEVTESVFMDRNVSIIEMFHKLKALGIRICLDDFGTGYSSLSYLQGLPIDVLKIDGSFTKNVASDHGRGKIVETILMLGRSLGTEVIAEGIETEEQLEYLKGIDCHNGQGFFFSRPVDEREIRAIIPPGSPKSS
jgi:diguanylate cyclase (GGDEF)-like protein/PAS domain S-box-containing protein